MNDQIDHELETRLRSAYRTGELPAAPSRLLDALERVPDAIVVGRRAAGTRPAGRRASFGLLGIAAVLAVGGALAIGGGGLLRGIVPAPTPQLPPSAVPGTVITYAIQWSSETPSDPATVARLLQVIEDRVAATGAVGLTVRAAGEDRIVVGLPAGLDTAPFRQLIGQRGETTFVSLGTTALERGDPVDPATNPALFAADGIAGASVGTDQNGARVVDIALTPAATLQFADYTAAHISEYFAIVVDGRVLTAPVIHSEVPSGEVQISQGSTLGGYPADEAAALVAILVSGPLPVAITEILVEPGPVDPGPTGTAPPVATAKPSASSVDRLTVCPPRLDVQYQQLECDQAISDALLLLPTEHPIVSQSNSCISALRSPAIRTQSSTAPSTRLGS